MSIISVIVPVYKVEKYIRRCVDSILSQTFKNFELILVDDGSPDNCGRICDEYAESDKRVKVIHQVNQGVSGARNSGLHWVFQNSKSEWISFIDSDDWVHENYLEMLYKAVVERNVLLSVCGYAKTNESTYDYGNQEISISDISSRKLFQSKRVMGTVVWGKLYHRTLFEDIRYPVGKIHEDEFVTWKIIYKVERIAMVDNLLYVYFSREDSIMHKKWSIEHITGAEAFEEQLDFFKEKNFEKEYLGTVVVYIFFLLKMIESINGQYANRHLNKKLKGRLRQLYMENRKLLNFSMQDYIKIYSMMCSVNMNIVPWVIAKKKHFVEVYTKKGIRGIVEKITRRG